MIIQDKDLAGKSSFKELWHRDVEESIRQGSAKPFVEEAILQVSNWGFSITDLQVQKKCSTMGFFPWLKFMYGDTECELTGFLGPIHIWQVCKHFLFLFNHAMILLENETGTTPC